MRRQDLCVVNRQGVGYLSIERDISGFIGYERLKEAYVAHVNGRQLKGNYFLFGYVKDQKPLIEILLKSQEAANYREGTGKMINSDYVGHLLNIDEIIRVCRDLKVVDPEGRMIQKSVRDIYSTKLLDEDSFWDSLFELEVATMYSKLGYEVRVVDEGEQGGPDLMICVGATPIWVECKSKRDRTPEEGREDNLQYEIFDQINKRVAIGSDSYYIEIHSSVRIKKEHIMLISLAASNCINEKKVGNTIPILDGSVKVELKGFHVGKMRMNRRTFERDPLGFLGCTRGKTSFNEFFCGQMKFESERNVFNIENTAAMRIFTPKKEFDYSDWVFKSIKKARANLSGYFPSIVWVNVPLEKWVLLGIEPMNGGETNITQGDNLAKKVLSALEDSQALVEAVFTASVDTTKSTMVTVDRITATVYKKSAINGNPDMEKIITLKHRI